MVRRRSPGGAAVGGHAGALGQYQRLYGGEGGAADGRFDQVDVQVTGLAGKDLDERRQNRVASLLVHRHQQGPAVDGRSGQLRAVRGAVERPVLVGSGVTDRTIGELLRECDGAIVGSWLKVDGDVSRPVDLERVKRLMDAARGGA